MSVEVNAISKQYGEQWAVKDLSFKVKKGEILGFLGPNGAGKSTTMKMLTGFIDPTEGDALVCGHSVRENSLELRRHVGYLPEHNPLYKDMYIREFLSLTAGIYKLANKKKQVEEIMELTGLMPEQNKKIAQLSKGFRQRVGLAQAMIHDPEVLILDEPTSGLDPNQLIEIRNLIQEIGQNKTVIFSSHIMQEVQALSDRVVILNEGSLIANDSIENLPNLIQNDAVIYVECKSKEDLSRLLSFSKLKSHKTKGANEAYLYFSKEKDSRSELFEYCSKNNIVLLEMRSVETTIEDVFQSLTVN